MLGRNTKPHCEHFLGYKPNIHMLDLYSPGNIACAYQKHTRSDAPCTMKGTDEVTMAEESNDTVPEESDDMAPEETDNTAPEVIVYAKTQGPCS